MSLHYTRCLLTDNCTYLNLCPAVNVVKSDKIFAFSSVVQPGENSSWTHGQSWKYVTHSLSPGSGWKSSHVAKEGKKINCALHLGKEKQKSDQMVATELNSMFLDFSFHWRKRRGRAGQPAVYRLLRPGLRWRVLIISPWRSCSSLGFSPFALTLRSSASAARHHVHEICFAIVAGGFRTYANLGWIDA